MQKKSLIHSDLTLGYVAKSGLTNPDESGVKQHHDGE